MSSMWLIHLWTFRINDRHNETTYLYFCIYDGLLFDNRAKGRFFDKCHSIVVITESVFNNTCSEYSREKLWTIRGDLTFIVVVRIQKVESIFKFEVPIWSIQNGWSINSGHRYDDFWFQTIFQIYHSGFFQLSKMTSA